MSYKPFWNMIHSKRINLFKPSNFITHYFFLLRRLYPNNPSTAVADARAVVAKKPTCVLVPVFAPLFLLGFSAGFCTGLSVGFSSGLSEGFCSGVVPGLSVGFCSGFASGFSVGFCSEPVASRKESNSSHCPI